MPMEVKESIIKRTAQVLGISEDEVTMETVVPNLVDVVTMVVFDTAKTILVNNAQQDHTVQMLIDKVE